jgi:hypothetical protein
MLFLASYDCYLILRVVNEILDFMRVLYRYRTDDERQGS